MNYYIVMYVIPRRVSLFIKRNIELTIISLLLKNNIKWLSMFNPTH